MIRWTMTCTESREKRVCNGGGTSASTVASFFAIQFFLISIFITVFLIQELASVPTCCKMKRFLITQKADARADTADLAKERAIHPWRALDLPAARRHSFSVGVSRPRLSLADVSAPSTPSEVYARAASAAAAAAGFGSDLGSPSFQPTFYQLSDHGQPDAAAALPDLADSFIRSAVNLHCRRILARLRSCRSRGQTTSLDQAVDQSPHATVCRTGRARGPLPLRRLCTASPAAPAADPAPACRGSGHLCRPQLLLRRPAKQQYYR
jgi:hypothetical protein